RKTNPRDTTSGPDCQTILRTGGTLRSAARRSRHPPQKLSRSAIFRVLRIVSGSKMPKPFRGFLRAHLNREVSNILFQLDRSLILQLFHVEFLGLALGTRNNATQVSAEVADTPSAAESIPGKQD